jgi:hypothetical protein
LVLVFFKSLIKFSSESIQSWEFLCWETLLQFQPPWSVHTCLDCLYPLGSVSVDYMYLEIYPFLLDFPNYFKTRFQNVCSWPSGFQFYLQLSYLIFHIFHHRKEYSFSFLWFGFTKGFLILFIFSRN